MNSPSAPHLSHVDVREPSAEPSATGGPRYERVARLGAGAMGRVWLARDRRLGREVALKELLDPSAALEARLRQEVAITASLDHPGIVPVYDLERGDDGRLVAVMRLVRGPTLRHWLTRQPSLAARVRRVAEVAHAVAFAHARGIVHRDLKPENILVEESGAAQVTDWGLARRLSDGPAQREGTEGFMAPELAPGEVPSLAADVFSLGKVLEACLPEPAPPDLRAVVARACAPHPGRRYPDAAAFAVELDAWLVGREVQAYAYGAAEKLARRLVAWRAPLAAAGVVFVIAFVGLSFAWRTAVHQRDRAVVAEDAARRRERHLLEAQAVTEAAAGAFPEAELLAAGALARGDSAPARGLLAALALEPTPQRIVRAEAPRCAEAGLFEGGHWCRQAVSTRLSWQGRTWHTPLRVREARAAGPSLVLRDEDEQLWLETSAAGTRWLGAARRLGVRLQLDDAHDLALSADRGRVVVFSLRSGAPLEERAPCEEIPLLATWLADGQVHHVCADGRHLWSSPGGVLVPASPPLTPRQASAILTVASRGDVVLFGTTAGEVWKLGVAGVEPLLELSSRHAISQLELSADGSLVAVVPAEGNPLVLDVRRGLRRASLPRAAAAAVAFEGDRVVTLAAGVETHWALPPLRAPALLTAAHGLATVAFAPRQTGEETIVAAGADGHLRRWGMDDGAVLDAPLQFRRTIKAVAPSGDDTLFVGGIDEEGLLELDLESLRPLRRWPVATRVKLLGLGADGRPWVLGYHVGPVRWQSAKSPARADEGRSWRDGAALDDGRAIWLDASGGVWLADELTERLLRTEVEATHVAGHSGLGLAMVTPRELCLFDFEGNERWRIAVPARPSALRLTSRWLLVGTVRGELLVFDATGRLVASHRGHEATVSALAVSPDGRSLASASWDSHVRRWDLGALDAPASVADAEARWGLSLEELLGAR